MGHNQRHRIATRGLPISAGTHRAGARDGWGPRHIPFGSRSCFVSGYLQESFRSFCRQANALPSADQW